MTKGERGIRLDASLVLKATVHLIKLIYPYMSDKAAYDYIKHDIASLNEPINAEEADGDNIRRGKDKWKGIIDNYTQK